MKARMKKGKYIKAKKRKKKKKEQKKKNYTKLK